MAKRDGTDLSQLHLGLEFVGGTLLFAGLGWWLDSRWGTEPWLAITGGALGLAGGMWLLVKEAMKANREAAAKFGKASSRQATESTEPTESTKAQSHGDVD
ncbi:MAG: AtpZ/AtpI family protein [Planctomycetota bacterium]